MIRSSVFATAPGFRVIRAGPACGDRDAAAPIWVTGDPPASAMPGYPYSEHDAVPMLVKSMTW